MVEAPYDPFTTVDEDAADRARVRAHYERVEQGAPMAARLAAMPIRLPRGISPSSPQGQRALHRMSEARGIVPPEGASLSGEWRRVNGRWELTDVVVVNDTGFSGAPVVGQATPIDGEGNPTGPSTTIRARSIRTEMVDRISEALDIPVEMVTGGFSAPLEPMYDMAHTQLSTRSATMPVGTTFEVDDELVWTWQEGDRVTVDTQIDETPAILGHGIELRPAAELIAVSLRFQRGDADLTFTGRTYTIMHPGDPVYNRVVVENEPEAVVPVETRDAADRTTAAFRRATQATARAAQSMRGLDVTMNAPDSEDEERRMEAMARRRGIPEGTPLTAEWAESRDGGRTLINVAATERDEAEPEVSSAHRPDTPESDETGNEHPGNENPATESAETAGNEADELLEHLLDEEPTTTRPRPSERERMRQDAARAAEEERQARHDLAARVLADTETRTATPRRYL